MVKVIVATNFLLKYAHSATILIKPLNLIEPPRVRARPDTPSVRIINSQKFAQKQPLGNPIRMSSVRRADRK